MKSGQGSPGRDRRSPMCAGDCNLSSAELPCMRDLALLVCASKHLSARLGHTWIGTIARQSSKNVWQYYLPS